MTHSDRRASGDRRKQPTPGLSRFTFFGRRSTFRRQDDKTKGRYVDRYSPTLFFLLVLIVGLNVLDAVFTMMILDKRGYEANPVVQSVMEILGNKFWMWKFALVAFRLVLLCLHSRFRLVRFVIICLTSIYLLVVAYQILILSH